MANIFSDKLAVPNLQTCFNHRLVVVVARGAAKEGLDYMKLVLQFPPEERRQVCDGMWRSPNQEFSVVFPAPIS